MTDFLCGPSPLRHPRPESVAFSIARSEQPRILMVPIGFPQPPASRAGLLGYAKQTREYWEASSYGVVTFDFDVAPNFVPNGPPPITCSPDEYTAQALAAARYLGYRWTHPVYMIGKLMCHYAGIGNVGYPPAWINADIPFGAAVTHEVGHNLGFLHSHGLAPGYDGTQELTSWPRVEYGDPFDVMGSGFGHCSALEKELRGWLPAILDLGRPAYARVVLSSLADVDGERAAEVDRGLGRLCFEYRQPVGLDANLGVEVGVVRLNNSNEFTYVKTLAVSETFTDLPGGVVIRFNGGGAFDVATFSPGSPTPTLPAPGPYSPIPYVIPPALTPAPEDRVPDPATELYLGLGQRFKVGVVWKSPAHENPGAGVAIPLTLETGAFWFFSASNYELVVKVLDGSAINGKFWVFCGSLSNVQFTLEVTDVATGKQRTYLNPQGTFASFGDTTAFDGTA